MYEPDNWVIVKITGTIALYKILAGWSGGYLDGNSWRISSGITSVQVKDNYYLFTNNSGSVYKCHKDAYTIKMNIANILDSLKEAGKQQNIKVELMPENTDWFNLLKN